MQFAKIFSTRPTYLNYHVLKGPPSNRRPTKYYMTNELIETIELYKAIPDLVCLMLVKICKMLLAAIETFQHTGAISAPWTRFFEGSQASAGT